jgi:hypothetical protein
MRIPWAMSARNPGNFFQAGAFGGRRGASRFRSRGQEENNMMRAPFEIWSAIE